MQRIRLSDSNLPEHRQVSYEMKSIEAEEETFFASKRTKTEQPAVKQIVPQSPVPPVSKNQLSLKV